MPVLDEAGLASAAGGEAPPAPSGRRAGASRARLTGGPHARERDREPVLRGPRVRRIDEVLQEREREHVAFGVRQ